MATTSPDFDLILDANLFILHNTQDVVYEQTVSTDSKVCLTLFLIKFSLIIYSKLNRIFELKSIVFSLFRSKIWKHKNMLLQNVCHDFLFVALIKSFRIKVINAFYRIENDVFITKPIKHM